VSRFWEVENLACDDSNETVSKDDARAQELMREGTIYDPVAKKYTTSLLFKDDFDPHTKLHHNYNSAFAVMKHAYKKVIRDGTITPVNYAYQELIDKQFCDVIPESLKFEGLEENKCTLHYFPTHPVYNFSSVLTSLPVRVVMNASSKCKTGFSLNDTLYTGETLLPDVATLLLRFRLKKYVFIGDIKKLFYCIAMKKEHQKYQRYIWQFSPEEKPIIMQHNCLLFGSVSSPFCAIWTVFDLCDRFRVELPLASKAVKDSCYMDDIQGLTNNRTELIEQVAQTDKLFDKASMIVHKINSNDKEALIEAGVDKERISPLEEQKVLGILWSTITDKIIFPFEEILDGEGDTLVETKRSLLRQTARLYDPIGIWTPFVLWAKTLLQKCWISKRGWDDPLETNILTEWEEWKTELRKLGRIEFDRRVCVSESIDPADYKLFTFSDGSDSAYGACIYLVSRNSSDSDNWQSNLIFAKSRVAPLKMDLTKPYSIARLELLGAFTATRIAEYVKKALKLGDIETFFFTDSLVTLFRIKRGPGSYQIWVANRLTDILSRSTAEQWRFTNGSQNPSDFASRPTKASTLVKSQIWYFGPSYICLPNQFWPDQKALTSAQAADIEFEHAKEIKKLASSENKTHILLTKAQLTVFSRWEKWSQVVRLTAWIMRWKTISKKSGLAGRKKYIDFNEFREAEFYWLKIAQQESFKEDILNLQNGLSLVTKSVIKQFLPFLDDKGFLRSQTRFRDDETLPDQLRTPLILPKHNQIVEKYVMHIHTLLGHTGPESTLFHLRKQFAIVGSRREVRRILHMCKNMYCNQPLKLTQQMSSLPSARTDTAQIWSYVSVDYFGPLDVLHQCEIVDCTHPKNSKFWGVLFTDNVTRAVSLDIVNKMDTVSFIMAFTRFISRKGIPKICRSDNMKAFRTASVELRRLLRNLDWDRVATFACERGIMWEFSVELAPHTNSSVERLVGSVKKGLYAALRSQKVSEVELYTVLTSIEAMINDRPLCCMSENLIDSHPITPALLCHGRSLRQIPTDTAKLSDGIPFTRLHLSRQRLQNRFWQSWQKDYLLRMQASKIWLKKNQIQPIIGQVVQIIEKKMSRNTFRLARIDAIEPGKDGLVRRLRLLTASGTFLWRSVHHIAVLEGQMFQDEMRERVRKAETTA
jgi:hypothetical protein